MNVGCWFVRAGMLLMIYPIVIFVAAIQYLDYSLFPRLSSNFFFQSHERKTAVHSFARISLNNSQVEKQYSQRIP